MDALPEQAADRESSPLSPLSSPPASTPGASPRVPSRIVTLRTSARAAAKLAQTAIKRNIADLDTEDAEEAPAEQVPAKRARVPPSSADKDGECTVKKSDNSPTTSDNGDAEDAQKNTMVEIIGSMAVVKSGATTGVGSAPSLKVDEVNSKRPSPIGKPLVWANGRGALCEALPYFRSFQGSLYSMGVEMKGLLIDSEVDRNDFFGAQVVITSIGGGRERNAETGAMVRAKDASDTSANLRSALKAYHGKTLVAVIVGNAHPLYPCEPPHTYSVLAYFHVTYMWKEKQIPKGTDDADKAVTIWRMRLEKADLTDPSWWATDTAIAAQSDALISQSPKTPVETCEKCGVESKEVFTVGWFCLNHQCKGYFMRPSGDAVDLHALQYTDEFYNERTPFVGEIPSIKPPVPNGQGLHGTELSLRRGFVCPVCGCCNRRVYWNRWVCENSEKCQYTRLAPMAAFPIELLWEENEKFDLLMDQRRRLYGVNKDLPEDLTEGFDPFATIFQKGYLQHSQTLVVAGYLIRQYFLPDAEGRVLGSFSILSPTDDGVFASPNNPDVLFRTLELTDIGLRRNPAALFGHKLEGYTRHFQQNFGARYKFGVSVQSKGFSEAPNVILLALQRLIWAKRVVVSKSNEFIQNHLGGKHVGPNAIVAETGDFNELLALGYMEEDKINYHDDGESELGPVVAALALGSPCTMRFRPKRKTQFFLPIHKQQGNNCYKEVLEVKMKHGDMMVMVGTDIQKVYEHTVDPHGKRRFSLTARYIDPERMTSQEDRDDAAVKGAIPPHAQAFVYDGF